MATSDSDAETAGVVKYVQTDADTIQSVSEAKKVLRMKKEVHFPYTSSIGLSLEM